MPTNCSPARAGATPSWARPCATAVVLEDVTPRLPRAPRSAVSRRSPVSRCAPAGARSLAVVGPSGCGKTTLLELICRLQAPERGRSTAPPAALMPQRDLLLPWLSAVDNAALALRIAGPLAREAREAASALFAEFGLDGLRAGSPARALRRHAPAGRLPAHTACPASRFSASMSPSARSTRSRARRCRAGSPMRSQREPRTVVLVTHDVEEAIVLADRVARPLAAPRACDRGARDRHCRARARAPTRRSMRAARARTRRRSAPAAPELRR